VIFEVAEICPVRFKDDLNSLDNKGREFDAEATMFYPNNKV
jgi:hypothetical protein